MTSTAAAAPPAAPFGTTASSTAMPMRLRSTHARTASHARYGSPAARATPAAAAAGSARPATDHSDDSSDDESSAAPKLSAAAAELLGGRASQEPRPTPATSSAQRQQSHVRNYGGFSGGSPVGRGGDDLVARERQALGRGTSPLQQQVAEPPARTRSPRIIRVESASRRDSPADAVRRTRSTGSALGSPAQREARDYKTPAPAPRPRSYTGNDEGSPIGSGRQAGGEPRVGYSGGSGNGGAYSSAGSAEAKDAAQQGTVTRDHGMHSSLRIKRLGQGSLLRGPARRGMIRKEESPLHRSTADYADLYAGAEKTEEEGESPVEEHVPLKVHFPSSGMPSALDDLKELQQDLIRRSPERDMPPPMQPMLSAQRKAPSANLPPVEPARLPGADKENQPPTSPHRRLPTADEVLSDLPLKPVVHSAIKMQERLSPARRNVLAAKSANTPLRPAPPPPKMNVVDTATAAAGAMAAAKRKKQAVASMNVNGRRYTRLDCIGRGGSGKVFRVMAENYKLYALKRVSLEGMDELAIRGFKGEINLLQKLKEVERVVRLIDYEVNDERQTLTVLMEMGELDLKKLLDPHLDEQTGGFDVTFTRHIWREMLECVQAVHEHDVVHSDLKPANFVMVQGKLKLIDFGIANAIADDTVNVHREQQIGTPNYMAPEALVDLNAHDRGVAGVQKLMKLGKPSDVWSLGCILYQIVYGKPPFGHIVSTHSKASAIVSDRHPISFPDRGLGGAPVPLGLLRTMKRCLTRDQKLRPSIPELLGERDPFLHPDADGLIPLNEELLGIIQRKLVSVIKQRGSAPDDGELAMWQSNMFENLRNAIREGKVQV